jgi:hypothetical protein
VRSESAILPIRASDEAFAPAVAPGAWLSQQLCWWMSCYAAVLSFPYPLRFLFASRPDVMGKVLGIVYRVIATHLVRSAGFTRDNAHTGAVTLIQRFGSALTNSPGANLNSFSWPRRGEGRTPE